MDIKRMHVGPSLSEAAIFNGVVYLAGQIAENMTQNIDGQMREVLGHIDRLLTECNSDKTRILSCQVFLADMADYEAMNAVWKEWVPQGHTPPRATVEARLARPELLVEVVVIAAQAS
jgi:enamine deaminase RidA (YjgF/YER057c/UK114 family)